MRNALNNWARHGSRSRNVKQPVRAGARALHLVPALSQTSTKLFIVDVTGQVMQAALEFTPPGLAEIPGVARFRSGLAQLGPEVFRTHGRSCHAEQFKLRIHAADTRQVVKSRDQFPLCKISR